ncbi:MAG: RluA family pseudouridine synthase [Patescibacteria group bacterium]
MIEKVRLIYEDENFLALYKPAGTLVHAVELKTKSLKLKAEPTLVDWLLKKYPEVKNVGDPSASSGQVNIRPGIVHRLDKNTSGVILIARHQKYFEYLKNLFQTGQIKKTYLALVFGKLTPRTGIIEKPISIKSGTIKRTIWKGRMEKPAVTEYKVLKYFCLNKSAPHQRESVFTLVKVMPKTGRTHQIRIHLSSLGHPIVGDSLYGSKTNLFELKRQFLHAESLEFTSEDGKKIKIEAGLPEELKNILHVLTN